MGFIEDNNNSSGGSNHKSTGLLSGGKLDPNLANLTTYIQRAGSGVIVDYTDVNNPVETIVSWAETTESLPDLATQDATVIYMDINGLTIKQSISTFPNSADYRTMIPIGIVGHPSRIQVDDIFNTTVSAVDAINKLADLAIAIGAFSTGGNLVTKNVGALTLNKSLGTSFLADSNFKLDNTNPSNIVTTQLLAPTLGYVKQDQFLGNISANVDVLQYDNGGVLTTLTNNNKYVAHRIWHQPSSNILFFQYGQAEYDSMGEAKNGFELENYIVPPALSVGAYIASIVIVNKGITNLDNPAEAVIIPQHKFGGTGGGSAGVSDTLQTSYDNSGNPEIETDAVRGSVDVRVNSGSDSDNGLTVQNSVGDVRFGIKGDGSIFLGQFTNTEMLAISTPIIGQTVYNTTWDKHYWFDGDVWLSDGLTKAIVTQLGMTEGTVVNFDSFTTTTNVKVEVIDDSPYHLGVVKDTYGGNIGDYVTIASNGVHNVRFDITASSAGNYVYSSSNASGGTAYASFFSGVGASGILLESKVFGLEELLKVNLTTPERL